MQCNAYDQTSGDAFRNRNTTSIKCIESRVPTVTRDIPKCCGMEPTFSPESDGCLGTRKISEISHLRSTNNPSEGS